MSIGIVTDIHGNVEALDAVLKWFDQRAIEEIWVLGDMIAMGPDSNEVMARLLDRDVRMILGNHDEAVLSLIHQEGHPASYHHTREHHEWVARHLEPRHVDALERLPRLMNEKVADLDVTAIHYHIPLDKRQAHIIEEPFAPIVEATLPHVQAMFQAYPGDLILFGHHHVVHDFSDGSKRYVNPGALGVARDDLARCALLSFGETGYSVSMHAIPYDKRAFLEKMERRAVPQRDVMFRLFYT